MISIPLREILGVEALDDTIIEPPQSSDGKQKKNIPGWITCPVKRVKGWLNRLFASLIPVTPLELEVVQWVIFRTLTKSKQGNPEGINGEQEV